MRKSSPKPGSRLSSSASIASNVASRDVIPVPPVTITAWTRSSPHASRTTRCTSAGSSLTIVAPITRWPAPCRSSRISAPLVSVSGVFVSETVSTQQATLLGAWALCSRGVASGLVIVTVAPRSVRSVGGLSKERPGSDLHVALHSTQGREVGAVGGWPEQGPPRLRSACRASFQPAPRGRGGRWVAWGRPAPPPCRLSRFIRAVGSARRRAVRAVEQLDEVEHPRSRPLGGEPGLDLEDAAGVGGDDRVGAGREDVTHLPLQEARRHLGLREVVDARRPAAPIGLGELDDPEPGDLRQEPTRLPPELLAVHDVTWVVIGHRQGHRGERPT